VDHQEQWEKIKEIVGAALDREPSERSAFLDGACSNDDALRAEVDSLLSAHAQASGLSESALATQFVDPAQVSRSFGPYQLLQKLGEGGMGQVWLVEQSTPVRRKVAMKLIKTDMCDDSVLRRFQSERQSLAIMDHPTIAKVFDAGATPDGQPYFVMEYVPGVAITEYCDQKKLKIRDRLELFIRACEGVQHAHQKAILHRDLKPANILVVEVDGKPMPRIIDFGLAKPVTPFISGESLNTQLGSFVGTPGYMSPEQADPGTQDVDTRTDVYSLGVILYELLTGSQPVDPARWKNKRVDEVLRQLREEDPLRPSTKVSSDRNTSPSRALARGTQPSQLVSLLRGDLDWITMKAIEKDRSRRYGTPSELAADLSRYLKNEPVIARPASAGYRLRKYVRRHRIAVAVAAGLVFLLAGFAAAQAVQLRRITRERDRANRITDFMTSMFKVSDPGEARGNSITARELLDKASKDIDTGLAKDPELQGQMMHVMGHVYYTLGLYPRGEALLTRAVDIRRRVLGPEHRDTLASMDELGMVFNIESRYPEAEKLNREVFEVRRRVLGPQNLDTLTSMLHLAKALYAEGRYSEAEKWERHVLDVHQRVLGLNNLDTVLTMQLLAATLEREGRYAEAEKMDLQVVDLKRSVQGPDHPSTLLATSSLGWVLYQEGRYAEAEKFLREAAQTGRRVLGPDHPLETGLLGRLATDLDYEGRYPEAETLQREVLAARRATGPERYETVVAAENLGHTLEDEGRYAEAEKLLREAVETGRRVLGAEHPEVLIASSELGQTLDEEGRSAEAEKLERETVDVQRRVLGPEHPSTLVSMSRLARVLSHERHYAEAEKLAGEARDVDRRVLGPEHPDTALSTYNLAIVEERLGKRDEALTLLLEAVDHGLPPGYGLGIEKDADFKSLHGDPRFDALVAEAHQRAAATQKPK
jgi:non-specific serine/threonine protein kinase/serine/threonine-protein kinase